MANGCVRTDNMAGTILGKNLVSVEYQVGGVATAIDNGNFVVVGNYKDGYSEVRVGTKPAVDSALSTIALIASEEVVKEKKYNSISDFTNLAGAIARGYTLESKDTFSLTAEAFDIASGYTPAVGGILELQADTKASLVASLTGGSTKLATLVAIEGIWYVFRV